MGRVNSQLGLMIVIAAVVVAVALVVFSIVRIDADGGGRGASAGGAAGIDGLDADARAKRDAAHEAAAELIAKGNLRGAQVILTRLLEMYPDDAKSHQMIAQVMMGRTEPDYGAAYAHLTRSLALDPDQSAAEFAAGMAAHAGMDQPTVAVEHFQRAAALDPDDVQYALYYGQVLIAVERPQEAEAELRRALRLDATLGDAHAMLAELAGRRGSFDEALAAIGLALQHAPSDKEVSFTVLKASLLRRAGQAGDGLSVLAGLGSMERTRHDVVAEQVRCLEAMGDWHAAGEAWLVRLAVDPTDYTATIEAGLHFVRLGNRYRARDCLLMAERLRPERARTRELAEAVTGMAEPEETD